MAKGRLLAIDDKPFYQRFYKNLFEDDGYYIHVVDSVEAGLEALNRESFDLVIADIALNEIKVSKYNQSSTSTHYDLELNFWNNDNIWSGSFSYNTDLFDASTIVRMAEHFINLLDAATQKPKVCHLVSRPGCT